MMRYSSWMVRVALSYISVVMFCLPSRFACAQVSVNGFQNTITIACENTPFEEVLQLITRQTNIHFIYSSNVIELNKRITLSIHQRPLQEAFELISRQADVAFRKQGDYVVLKKIVSQEDPLQTKAQTFHKNLASSSAEDVDTDSNNMDDKRTPERKNVLADGSYDALPSVVLKKQWRIDLVSIDTSLALKYFPLVLDDRIFHHRPKKWFASLGPFVNDYSAGMETQVGIPAFYGVVNASLLRDNLLRIGYGVGTSIPVTEGFSWNLAYTYASLQKEYYAQSNVTFPPLERSYKTSGRHHQVRIMAQFNLSKKISARIGPTFNYVSTVHTFQSSADRIVFAGGNQVPSSGYRQVIVQSNDVISLSTQSYSTSNFSMSFEGGLFYRIKFSFRK